MNATSGALHSDQYGNSVPVRGEVENLNDCVVGHARSVEDDEGSFGKTVLNHGKEDVVIAEASVSDGTSVPLQSEDDEGYLGGQEDFGESVPVRGGDVEGYLDGQNDFVVGEASVPLQNECDEGYLGGQEGDDESCGILMAGWGTDDIEEIDTGTGSDGGSYHKDASVHLGDCGCVTGEDNIGTEDEDFSLEDSDSAESEDEDDNTVEVDFSQEIYVDKTQVGVPYKKRYVIVILFIL